MSGRVWAGLDPVQADGLACVVCGRDFRTPGSVSVPVGRSHTGSQVFACVGECAAATGEPAVGRRAAPGEVAATGGTAVPLGVPVEAVDALCDATASFYRQDLEVAVRETAAPLVVAAELRRLAGEMDPATGPAAFDVVNESCVDARVDRAREWWAGYLRARADQLDGGDTR